jgi:hypothetical protein
MLQEGQVYYTSRRRRPDVKSAKQLVNEVVKVGECTGRKE